MLAVGDELVNPRSGERFVWRATAESTGGEYCEFDLHLRAGAQVAAPHVHPHQTESFTVVEGTLSLRTGLERRRLFAGDSDVVPPGITHAWGNAADASALVVVRLTPALRIEEFFERFCVIASNGAATKSGLPKHPLRLALLLDDHRSEFGFPTSWQRRLLTPVVTLLARVARSIGVSPTGSRPD